MKISEMRTDSATDVLCEIVPYINDIASDEKLLAEIKRKVVPDKELTRAEYLAIGVEKINNIVPILLKDKKNDIYGIIGALNDKTIGEIADQPFLVTLKQIQEIIKDKDLIDFFASCVHSEGDE